MKIGIVLPNWIGDAVMATPMLRAVRENYPQAEIVGLLRPYVAEVLEGLNVVDRIVLHEPRGKTPSRRGWRFVGKLRQERFDMMLLLPNSIRSGWLAYLSGAKRRVGIDRDGRGWMLTDRLPAKSKKDPHPAIDEYLRIAQHIGCTEISREMELATTNEDEQQLEQFWKQQSWVARSKGVICLNPGGAFGAAKHWPSESFADLSRRIAENLGKTVLVLCGPGERHEAREIVRLAEHRDVVSLADVPLTIGLTKAAIKSAELLVTTDSGPRHFAPPFHVPVVTLFGPTHIAWSETFYERATHLQEAVECGPCQQRVCPLGHHQCMRDLKVDRVYSAVVALLQKYSAKQAVA